MSRVPFDFAGAFNANSLFVGGPTLERETAWPAAIAPARVFTCYSSF